MCGIAGFSIGKGDHRRVNCRQLARELLLSIQARGEDATGAAWSETSDGVKDVMFAKLDIPADEFVKSLHELMPKHTRTAILHTRFATQGDPEDNDNNHPIVVGKTVGVHNGVIINDDALFADEEWERIAEVDSEAIFQLIEHATDPLKQLHRLQGRAAIAWFGTEHPDTLHLARLDGSPLYIGTTLHGSLVFASTRPLLEEAAKAAGVRLGWVREVPEFTYMRVEYGKIVKQERIPRPFRSEWQQPRYSWEKYPVFQSQANRAVSRGAQLFPVKK